MEQKLSFYENESLWETAPCILLDYHKMDGYEAILKAGTLEELTENDLKILQDAGSETLAKYSEMLKETEMAYLDKFTSQGATIQRRDLR